MRIFGTFLITLFLVFLVLVPGTFTTRPKTADDLVNLVTRREWFSDNNVDYMLALDPFDANLRSYVDVGPVSFGESNTLNLVVSVYPTAQIRKMTLFHAYSTLDSQNPSNDKTFKVVLVNSEKIAVTIGSKTLELQKKSRSYGHPSDEDWVSHYNPSLLVNQWNHISIDITTLSDSSSSVMVVVNKRYWNNGVINSTILNAFRDNSYLGASWNNDAGVLENFLVGYVDNFALMGLTSDQNFRKSLRTCPFTIDSTRKGAVQLLLDFNDALVSVGTTTVAITKSVKPDVFWVVAVLANGASFSPRSDLDEWFECYATGDPHGYKRPAKSSSHVKIDNLEDQPGGKIFIRCGGEDQGKNNASEFEVRTYTRYTFWWRWSVFRLIAIRYQDFLYRINLDETADIEHSTLGHITPKLNIPAGAYRKQISSSDWEPIPFYTSKTFNLEQKTGALYSYYAPNSYSRSLVVKAPGIGSVQVDAPEATFSSCRYMNLYVTLNEDLCPEVKRGRSTCDNDLQVNADPLYRDWLPPPPLLDNPEPSQDPCALVPTEFKAQAANICGRIYPSDQNKKDDCIFDACAAADIEVVLLNRPTPECMLSGLKGNSTACDQLLCPNFCSFRGECNRTLKRCTCDPGYVGKDCGQKSRFSCYDLSYGTQGVKVSSQYVPVPASNIAQEFFGQFGVESSALLYTVYDQNNVEHLLIINNHASGPYAGSYNLCLNFIKGNLTATNVVQKANSRCLGKHVTTSLGSNCYKFNWEAYGSGGLILDLAPGEIELEFTVSNQNGLKQIIYGSPNGKGNLDVLKVPSVHHGSFKLHSDTCNSADCSLFDGQCRRCAEESRCGYCVESGRCMLGDRSGPWNGVCLNWRFTFNEQVSRVVTVEYDATDLVNPDTEVYLNSVGALDGVPVNIYVPTITRSFATDVLLLLSTQGNFAVNSQQFKRNFANMLGPFSSDNVNFGLGFYDENDASITLSMTRADPNNFFTFTRALEATIGRTSNGNGGQQHALNVASGTVSAGFRQHSRKYVFITVYSHNSNSKNDILALRDNVLARNFLPIWVVVGNNTESRDFFQNEIVEEVEGIPGLVLSMSSDGDDLYNVIRNGIRLGSTLPSVVIKTTNPENNHIDLSLLNQQPETLFISGLSDVGLRAWFRIPMKRGDPQHHVANIVVPGFGRASIADVSNTRPIAKSDSYFGDEGVGCLQITLIGSSYKNILPVVFRIITAPTSGRLFEYDPTKPNSLGHFIPVGLSDYSDGSSALICYQPKRFFQGSDSFIYQAYDGCSNSDNATISIEIRNIDLIPTSENTAFTVPEKQNISLNGLFKCVGGDEGETIRVNVQSITYDAPSFFEPVSTNNFFLGGSQIANNWNGPSVTPVAGNNFEVSFDGNYVVSSPLFWGTYNIKYVCVDSTNYSSFPSTATINVTQVLDPPFIYLQDYTPIEGTWYEVKFSVKDFDVPITSVVIEQQAALEPYTISNAANGAPLSFPFTCYSGSSQFSVACSFFFKLNNNNSNSCPVGSGNCDEGELLTSVSLKVVANGGSLSSQSLIDLSVYPENDPPTVEAPSVVTTPEHTTVDFVVVLRDVDQNYASAELVLHNDNTEFDLVEVSSQTFSDRKEFNLQVVPVFNVFGTFHVHIEGYDGLVHSNQADVLIRITYKNDPPIRSDVYKTLSEDTSDYVDIAQLDPDNEPDDLTYRILVVPEIVLNDGETVPAFEIKDGNGFSFDLSQPIPTGSNILIIPHPDYFNSLSDMITFSVTDKDLQDNTATPNTVVSYLYVSVNPVNDPPSCVIPSVIVTEDFAAVIHLEGRQTTFGETTQLYVSRVTSLPFDLVNPSAPDQGKFYQYDDRINTLTTAQFEAASGVVLVQQGDVLTDADHRVIYIPPKDKNSDPNIPRGLFAHPYFRFTVNDGAESNECLVQLFIESTNDNPVAWNQLWPGRPDLSYTGIDPVTNQFLQPNNTCFRLCKGLEDRPLQIYLGGQDVDYYSSSLTLRFKITQANCPAGTTISYTDNSGNTVTLTGYPSELNRDYPAGLLNGITFTPAPNTFNSPNPNYTHQGGFYSELYCSVHYVAIDQFGAESPEQKIDVSIQEMNDVPLCVGVPFSICSYLNNITTIDGTDGNFIYQFVEVIGYEDKILYVYANFTDMEDDRFYPFVYECDPAFGKIYMSNDLLQLRYMHLNGSIINTTGDFDTRPWNPIPIRCGPFINGPYGQFSPSAAVTPPGTYFRGYYFKFVPNRNEYGPIYNKVGVLVTDDLSQTLNQFLVVYYFITILPVNDRPEIYINQGNQVVRSTGPVQYTLPSSTTLLPFVGVVDVDAEELSIEITLTTSSGASVSALNKDGVDTSITDGSPLSYTGTIAEINRTLSTLTFQSSGEGASEITVTINDNGATGNCPPGQSPLEDGSCPQINELKVLVTVSNGSPISAALGIAASAGLGGFLILGIAAAVLAVKKLKNKKTDSWKEFNEDNFKEFGQSNPLFEESTKSVQNPLYINSRESIELSNY